MLCVQNHIINILSEGEVLISEIEGDFGKDRAFYRHGALEIEPAEVDVAVDEEKCQVRVSAKEKYLHAVVISADALLSDNCFSLLPNETKTVAYKKLDGSENVGVSAEAYTLRNGKLFVG